MYHMSAASLVNEARERLLQGLKYTDVYLRYNEAGTFAGAGVDSRAQALAEGEESSGATPSLERTIHHFNCHGQVRDIRGGCLKQSIVTLA
jgi:hypothetical protein